MMEGFEAFLQTCRVSVMMARAQADEPTGIDDVVAMEEAALETAMRISAFLGRMADPDGDAFAQGLGWESAPLLKDYLSHGLSKDDPAI